jgi:hypothetical protein
MPDVHLPHLEDHDEEEPSPNSSDASAVASAESAASPPAPRTAPRKRTSKLLTIALEVVLISTGVFLGLLGEQWRESSRHHQLAQESLQRFREEILENRKAVSQVKDYHLTWHDTLQEYLDANDQSRQAAKPAPMQGIQSVIFDHTAWDVAIATQSLGDLDPKLVFSLSHIYNKRREYENFTQGLIQAMYVRPPSGPADQFFRALVIYYDDVDALEPTLIKMYDDILPQLNQSLGDSAGEPNTKK